MLQKSTNNKADFFAIFLLIFCSNDTLLFGTNSNRLFFWVHIMILAALLGWLFVKQVIKSNTVTREQALLFVSLMGVSLLSCISNLDLSIKYFYEIFVFSLIFLVVTSIPFDTFSKAYRKVMYILACASILAFIVYTIYPGIVRFLPSITNKSDLVYYFYGLGFLEELPAKTTPRMYGIFREPGVFMIFLSIALILEVFSKEKVRLKRIIAYIIGLLITFSTAAYIVLPLVFITYLFVNKNIQKDRKRTLLAILITVVLAIVVIGPDKIFNIVFAKLGIANSSRDSRFASIPANVLMMAENPLLGKGWTFVEQNFTRYAMETAFKGGHNTNTIFKMLAVHGIPYTLIVLYYLFGFFKRNICTKTTAVFLTIILCIILSNEDMIVNSVVYAFIFYGARSCARNSTVENGERKYI